MKLNKRYDVFNGDADGICSLQQLRLVNPQQAELVTGLKRDIALLEQCLDADEATEITVLDVSLDKNRDALEQVLIKGAKVFYADHHFTGDVPKHKNFSAHFNLSADTCTALIVNRYLNNAFPLWAVVGAFGDNLDESAKELADSLSLTSDEQGVLKKLGISLNYNGYGFTLDDLIFHPADLYKKIQPYVSPFDFVRNDGSYAVLYAAYCKDMELAETILPFEKTESATVYCLPNEKWARRVNGVFANQLAHLNPIKAHAVLVAYDDGFRVSVRAPLNNKIGADELCRQFETGGGRKAAAGINFLPTEMRSQFITAFKKQFTV
jgi:hypothetical protein